MGIYLIVIGAKTYENYQINSTSHTEQKVHQFYALELERKFYTP